jgi:CheY-like chemotaxis protein
MGSIDLNGLSILVVEDEAVTAIDTACTIVRAGGTVVGPAYSLNEAFEEIEHARIDVALLDINLRNERVFRLADALADRGVPIVFLSAEVWPVIPERHAGCRRVSKPVSASSMIAALRSATTAPDQSPAYAV